MDSNLAAALLGAFVGAVGGGAASLVGSVIVNRLQLRREMRIRIYDELLPKLIGEYFGRSKDGSILAFLGDELPSEFNDNTLLNMHRAAVIAGRGDLAKVKRLDKVILERQLTSVRLRAVSDDEPSSQSFQELAEKDNDIGRKLFELNDYLARKLV